MNTFLKFGIFNLLMITGWFDLYAQETGEKLSEIEKQVDAMMERIQRLKEQKSATEKPAKQPQPFQRQLPSPNPVSEAPLPETEKSSVDEHISTVGGAEQNASLPISIISEFPIVETFSGTVALYEESTQSFIPVERGFMIEKKTLMRVPAGGELIISFPGKMAALVGENSRVITGPAEEGKFEVYLKNGTVSALLDPERKREDSIPLSIRTRSGVAEAQGTFYAVTEYKGQSYTAVKKGKIEKETKPPTKPDFSAYLSKAKAKAKLVSSKK